MSRRAQSRLVTRIPKGSGRKRGCASARPEARVHLPPAIDAQLRSFTDIVNDYRRSRPAGDCDINWYRTLSLKDAIERAARAETRDGKRHPHQSRISLAAISKATQTLRELTPRIKECRSFDQLHQILSGRLISIRGIGEMYVYDCAQRIGASLGLDPEAVFLHRGTRVGAQALVPDAGRRKCIRVDELPAPLRQLSAGALEDVLCIYKSALKRIGSR